MSWGILVANAAKKDLRAIPRNDLRRIDEAFESMIADPFSGDIERIKGRPGLFRRRVGAWPIFFEIDKGRRGVLILAVKRRTSTTY